jgi:hypothetical protein
MAHWIEALIAAVAVVAAGLAAMAGVVFEQMELDGSAPRFPNDAAESDDDFPLED